jgi:hypothetical protein
MPVFFENRIGRTSTTVVDMRLLELRSGLFFEYPKLRLKDKNLIFFLPFFENPIITQSKEARLISYDLINQNSTLFSHVGAKAREISLTMTLTIPHIMRSINSIENSQRLLKTLSTETEKKRFGAKNILNPVEKEFSTNTTVAEEVVRHWRELLFEGQGGTFGSPPPIDINTGQTAGPWTSSNQQISLDSEGVQRRDLPVNISKTALRAINSAIYILETIKTSVTSHGRNSILGPPTLRLRHGAMYVDVPCICKSYNITVEEAAGYDLKTLLPNRIVIQLDLAELRGGDFTSFSPGTPVKRDNMVGWESAIMYGTTDPGYLR